MEALAEAKEARVRLGPLILVPPAVIKRVRRLRSKGHTLDHIAQALNADGIPTAHGGVAWYSGRCQRRVQARNLSYSSPTGAAGMSPRASPR